jgi:hypothetical protein
MGITPNDYVRVKLTEYGRNVLRQQHDDLKAAYPKTTLAGDGVPDEDADGWSEWQLWWLMQKLGGTGASAPLPFNDFEIVEKAA